MEAESFISDDPGTILDSHASVPNALPAKRPPERPAASPSTPRQIDELPYKSPYCWAAPRLVICDAGSLEDGELWYVRSDRVVIGRTTGDITFKYDVAMSASHAEVARRDIGGKHAWVLQDLGSSNGTLVKVKAVTLKPGMTIQLGSKRYHFDASGKTSSQASDGSATEDEPKTYRLADRALANTESLPALVENAGPGSAGVARYPFRSAKSSVGRPGCGNDIEIDDPCLAAMHAVVTRDASGSWHLEALPSINGVWAKISAIRLANDCHFQCGEQRFRFVLP